MSENATEHVNILVGLEIYIPVIICEQGALSCLLQLEFAHCGQIKDGDMVNNAGLFHSTFQLAEPTTNAARLVFRNTAKRRQKKNSTAKINPRDDHYCKSNGMSTHADVRLQPGSSGETQM